MSSINSRGGSRHVALDGLRGVAALLVVLHHLQLAIGIGGYFERAYLAVDFFFALSGFVVAAAYERRMAGGFFRFARVRMIRLYPLVALSAILGALAVTLMGAPVNIPVALIANILLVPGLAGGLVLFPLNGAVWSLFWELAANFTHALAFRWASVRVLTGIIVLAAIALVAACWKLGHLSGGWGVTNWWQAPVRIGFSYPLGVLMYRLYTKDRLPSRSLSFGVLAAAMVVTIFLASSSPWPVVTDLAVAMLVWPTILCLGLAAKRDRFDGLAAWLGLQSYSLYVIQASLIGVWTKFAPPTLLSAALMLPVVILGAVLAERFYDRPVREALTARLQTAKAAA